MVEKHLITPDTTVRDALRRLNELSLDAVLFVIDERRTLIGSVTDGDIRRGLINGLDLKDPILSFAKSNPAFIFENDESLEQLDNLKGRNLKVVPVVNSDGKIIDIINFRTHSSRLPVDAVLMAGGEGKRLRPLTLEDPKPLLRVGGKPIIEYNIDRLAKAGVKNMYLSINYLGDKIEKYFGSGESKNLNIRYIKEPKPLGTIGSILLVDEFQHDDIIVMNSDLLTNIDFVDFYKTYKNSKADMAVAATTYSVDIPYAVLESDERQRVLSIKEKPRYHYHSNAGIYIIKKKLLSMIPANEFYDITDLMEKVLAMDLKLITFQLNCYWLDIGKHDDFKKAQEDIKHLIL